MQSYHILDLLVNTSVKTVSKHGWEVIVSKDIEPLYVFICMYELRSQIEIYCKLIWIKKNLRNNGKLWILIKPSRKQEHLLLPLTIHLMHTSRSGMRYWKTFLCACCMQVPLSVRLWSRDVPNDKNSNLAWRIGKSANELGLLDWWNTRHYNLQYSA